MTRSWIIDLFWDEAEKFVIQSNTEIAIGKRGLPKGSYYEIGSVKKMIIDMVGVYLITPNTTTNRV